ncbi:MAG: hypothetical protein JO317_08515, partial [Verrucomicrobiae bacterium]|nr:hypothetical protein [Verrucomicrobiae bacterium]
MRSRFTLHASRFTLGDRAFVALLALLIAVLALASVSVEIFALYEDEGIYAASSESLLRGHGYRVDSLPGQPPNAKYPPAYPIFIAGLRAILPLEPFEQTLALKLSGALFLWGLAALFYRDLKKDFGWERGRARIAALFLATASTCISFSTVVMTEMMFTLVLWMMLRTAWRNHQPSPSSNLAVVAWGVLIYYLRTAGVAFWAAYLGWRWRLKQRRAVWIAAAAWIAATIPWKAWCAWSLADFARREPALSKLLAYYLSYGYHIDAVRSDASPLTFILKLVLKNAVDSLSSLGDLFVPIGLIYASNLTEPTGPVKYFPILGGVVVILLAGWGFRRLRHPAKLLIVGALVAHVGLFLIWPWPFSVRFYVPVFPLLILGAGEALKAFDGTWERVRNVVVLVVLGLQWLMTLSLTPGGTMWIHYLKPQGYPFSPAFQAIRDRTTTDDVILTGFSSQWVSHETGRPSVRLATVLPPRSALQVEYHLRRADDDLVRQYWGGLRQWQSARAPRGR